MPEITPSRYVVHAGWEHAPHLDEQTKRDLLAGTPPHLRDARSKGIPSLGEGAIYPVPWEEVSCDPFLPPPYWRRCFALDVGWRKTAAMWLAEDPADGVLYAYAEYYRGEAVPAIHAAAVKARGEWIPGVIDPASQGRTQDEGKRLITQYRSAGLTLRPANNAVEPGIYAVWQRLETGRLKFFTSLRDTEEEYRLYRRVRKTTETGERVQIVKKKDHLMDCLRYGVVEFDKVAIVRPAGEEITGSGFSPVDKRAGY
jgi:hypothetical protein